MQSKFILTIVIQHHTRSFQINCLSSFSDRGLTGPGAMLSYAMSIKWAISLLLPDTVSEILLVIVGGRMQLKVKIQ
jgi:hypothetical protein